MLVYTSEATNPRDPNLVSEIVKISRQRNDRDKITGSLVLRSGHFLQLLEGAEQAVRGCYARILKDPRHRSITLQGEAYTSERSPPIWSMGVVANAHQGPAIEGILNLFDLARQNAIPSAPEALLTMLRIFAKDASIVV